ncbi:DUF4083 family protein [Chengkuizengella axinellae]|uniref:DUF4083 family protein n=1 Tax=Chengkuizengella axinellae TaxID=3064388 RepID=A0ABT9IV62_9BACL|nr:DUF4083 family protein [Chengkuizengella sp. 2205SS18-9]MDP5273207.1 DUF4083 family protein [Chengkuizengella sp. 2205SS18-9]
MLNTAVTVDGSTAFIQILFFLLIILFIVSFVLFIRRLIVNSTANVIHNAQINKKLDRVIELLEKKDDN